ncbi:SDR family NAD(P)-dependent oxidoreductase [Agrobacterium tumefaciens]|uniref:SDR family NAD(P)-dependent oxidoreductase n=1 Tax=Agrobacterium tumefaciens TaxID=358 RepID=UPI0008101519|nr:SDR family oxidoreductase [Agrobacterium tumefaciens]NSL21721.1 SDR family oxidoreductase [Agrobacterium tumefaciens]NTC58255.1 SDR family oxidoreductase [Agrobacterium tumefaciens]NTC60245.1 SDR family oxidoreductase [Agrobacterium tumefaciens]NTC66746.1 SDR family oxidoreductase [Agrobacterium tumefaciens]NTC71092.1 SDR family oxidoreductase [Agrobacterium tumefaciens]
METGLKGKVVFITGAAEGIGRATALAFAKEGATVGLLDLNDGLLRGVAAEIAKAGGKAELATADLSTGDGVKTGLDTLLAATGGVVDVLVNNVGSGAIRTFEQLTDDEWDKTFQLNFMSYVRATRHLLPILRERKGNIINNGSDLARQPEPVPIDYSTSKAAVLALTKGLARAEGPNVRVNAVAPGPIWTPFWTKPGGFAETMGKHYNMEPQAAVEHEMKLRQLPLARLGNADEVANVIVFLASDLASFVTSAVWGVDGGSIRAI